MMKVIDGEVVDDGDTTRSARPTLATYMPYLAVALNILLLLVAWLW